ncbi:MAG: triose-phosphate isomerase [Thermodesulfobacteriota bacterium]
MEPRKPLIAGNWKMHKTCPAAVETAREVAEKLGDTDSVEVMIAPPFTALTGVFDVIKDTAVALGAQNLFREPEGAYTGEVSGPMIRSAGCCYVIVGHSERRQFFEETDDQINGKIKAAIDARLAPVFCVGETEEERDAEKTFSVLDKQVQNGLKGLLADHMATVVIAYEPVWAIGTGKTATPEQVQAVHVYIRELVGRQFGETIAQKTRILYGGSVKPANISELMALPDIDGALVGGASLKPDTFSEIVKYK